MALLSFPPNPVNGQTYPATPVVGQNQYQYESATLTWRLLGSSTGVTPNTYGDATHVGQFTVDAQGRITFAADVPIASGAGGTVTQVDTGLGLTGGPITATGTISALQATPISEGIVFGYTDGVSVALGVNALLNISSGINNTAIGDSALLNNGVGNNNTAVGTSALCANVGGSLNTAVGVSSLKNSTGTLNTATGFGALINSTIGSNNAGFGADAGFRLTTGACNTALGTVSLFNTTTGSQNVGVGYSAGCNITTGSQNVAIGPSVTVSSATGSGQLAIGFATNQNWLTGDSSKAIKPGAGIIDNTGSCGTNGQVLMSTGANSVCWGGGLETLQSITDNGATTTNSIDVAGLTAAGLSYPLTDGTADQVVATDGAGNLGWLSTLKVVTAPTASTDAGALGQVAVSTGFFYFFDGTQWLQVAGSTF